MKKNIHFEDLNKNCGFYYHLGKSILSKKSKFQKIDIWETDLFGKTLNLDGITQVGIKGERFYHEPMVHLPLLSHPHPQKVLVIGGGDGGINREVLKYPSVDSLVQVDLDAEVVSVCKKHLPEISQGCWEDPRTTLVIEDGRHFLTKSKGKFDVVIMDMTDPFGPSASLYTKEFFTLAKHSLRHKKGVFCMHSESPISRPKAFSSIHRTLSQVFKHVSPWYIYVQMYGTYWSLAICSDKAQFKKKSVKSIDQKIKKLKLKDLHIISGATYRAFQTEMPVIKDLRQSPTAKIITDADSKFPDEAELVCFYERK